MTLDSREARARQPFCHLGRLLGRHFDGEGAPRLEKIPRFRREAPQQLRTLAFGEQRLPRLVGCLLYTSDAADEVVPV